MLRDGQLLEEIQKMDRLRCRTDEQEQKYRELTHEYYVLNADIRLFWKTF